jgi:nitrilase
LLRTRAIENQAYVVAAAQLGVKKQGSFMGFGHSMVVDPWGDIIGQMSDQEGIFISELDLNYLDQVRGNMNSLTHIRTDSLLPEY